jgi:G3E family GTPase
VAAVKRRLNVRSASFDRLIISSTGLATEKFFASHFCALAISPSP